VLGAIGLAAVAGAESWFVAFPRTQVAPVQRSETGRLVEAGTIDTDGFKELVFSLGGEFKEGVPASGRIGVLLLPDNDVVLGLLRNENQFIFPLEAIYEVKPGQPAMWVSPQQTARIAFPRYRVFMYNETSSGAEVALFLYKTR
jgi:hypothetical protein